MSFVIPSTSKGECENNLDFMAMDCGPICNKCHEHNNSGEKSFESSSSPRENTEKVFLGANAASSSTTFVETDSKGRGTTVIKNPWGDPQKVDPKTKSDIPRSEDSKFQVVPVASETSVFWKVWP